MFVYYVPQASAVEPRSSTTILIVQLRSHINPTFDIQLLGFSGSVGRSILLYYYLVRNLKSNMGKIDIDSDSLIAMLLCLISS
jgi:hypothetical protein